MVSGRIWQKFRGGVGGSIAALGAEMGVQYMGGGGGHKMGVVGEVMPTAPRVMGGREGRFWGRVLCRGLFLGKFERDSYILVTFLGGGVIFRILGGGGRFQKMWGGNLESEKGEG